MHFSLSRSLLTLLLIADVPFLMGSEVRSLDPVQLLSDFMEVDTINPPGNESNAVAFYAALFDDLGIQYESGESAPGRGNIWARLPGGQLPGLMLLQHTDVVPADDRYWDTPALKSVERDGYLFGRGAIDMKGTGIAQFMAFVTLAQSKTPLARDVVFMATADEEAGGYFGADWVIKQHPEAFQGIGFVLNEGGSGNLRGDQKIFSIEVTQKVPVWLALSAEDIPGHGSYPRPTSSVTRVIDALSQLRGQPFPIRVIPEVDRYFKALAATLPSPFNKAFLDIEKAVQSPEFVASLHLEYPGYHALLRDTCSITMLTGSSKINVVPPTAEAQIDCRMLPDRGADAFIEDVAERVEGTGVEVTKIMAFSPAISDWDTPLLDTIQAQILKRHPDARFASAVSTGFTDSHFTRDLGIQSYGFSPMLYLDGETKGVHGNNEAVHIGRYRQAVDDYVEIVEAFTQL